MASKSRKSTSFGDAASVDVTQLVAGGPKGSRRDISTEVIENVLSEATRSFAAAGLPEEVVEKFRSLWTQKLEEAKSANPSLDLSHEIHDARFHVSQVDGPDDTSDEEEDEEEEMDKEEEDDDDDDDEDDNDDDDALNDDEENEDEGVEDEPLGSGDDISDEDPSDLFDTENVVVCQYDKITRARNKWKFHLKDGIMNLNGKDYVFNRATGDAEW